MLLQVAAVEYLHYLKYDRNFKDMKHRTHRIGRLVMFWLDKQVEDISFDDITNFKQWMFERKCSLNYINTYLFIFRSFLRFCQMKYKIKTIPPSDIKPFKVQPRTIDYLTKEEAHELMQVFNGTSTKDYRCRAMLAVLMDTGLRISECTQLNRSQLEEIIEKGHCKITGKGNKDRLALFSWSKEFLEDYIQQRTDCHEAMFVSHCPDPRWKEKRIDPDGVRHHLREISKKLGKHISPHLLRRTAINTWKMNGMDIKVVSLIAGHESVKTTEKYYLGLDWAFLQKQHEKFSYI